MSEGSSANPFVEHAAFFTEVPHRLGASGSNEGSVFNPQGSGLCSVMRFVGQLPANASEAQKQALQALYRHHRDFLEPAIEMSAAWIGKSHQFEPESWLREDVWGQPLAQMPAPFYDRASFAEHHIQQNLRGTELPRTLLGWLAEWTDSGSQAPGGFDRFLTDLGDQVRARIAGFEREVQSLHVVFNYRPVRDAAGNWTLQSSAELYFLTLNRRHAPLYSGCASTEVFGLDFSYRKGTLALNGDALDAGHNAAMRDTWRSILNSRIRTPLDEARYLFEAKLTVAG